MLIRLAIFAIILVGTQEPLPMHRDNQHQQAQQESSEAKQDARAATASDVEKENASNAERYAYYKAHPKEYVKAAFAPANLSNWVLAGLGMVGGFLAGLTVWIIKRQGDHIITSERAWLIATVINPAIGNEDGVAESVPLFWKIENKGKTPAFVIESAIKSYDVHGEEFSSSSIQSLPEFDAIDICKWDRTTVLPRETLDGKKASIVVRRPREILLGSRTLWVYGYVKYEDSFGQDRETRFCYEWSSALGGLVRRGPEGYNRAK